MCSDRIRGVGASSEDGVMMMKARSRSGWAWLRRNVAVAGLAWSCTAWGAAPTPVFTEDFSRIEVGQVPDGFLVLDGAFQVKADGAEKFLELPGAPLESYGLMFGSGNKEDWGAQARVFGTLRGRRFPVFGVSVNGVGGYRVVVAPAKRAIELLKGDEVKASAEFIWEDGTWTQVRVQIRKLADGTWKVEGKAWKDGEEEPSQWLVGWTEADSPVAGRAAVWGQPFAGTPIRFDDLRILPVTK